MTRSELCNRLQEIATQLKSRAAKFSNDSNLLELARQLDDLERRVRQQGVDD